jgi:hypothetical protein
MVRRLHDAGRIHVEEGAQRGARVAAAEAVGAERQVAAAGRQQARMLSGTART